MDSAIPHREKIEPNAELISSAPELLDIAHEALRLVEANEKDLAAAIMPAEDKQDWEIAISLFKIKILDAIAKAEGEEK